MPLVCQVAPGAMAESQPSAPSDSIKLDEARLRNRRFEFSWKSAGGSGTNGNAWLKTDGTIQGIRSPNETTWCVGAVGRLEFRHADGRVSTRFDQVQLVDGRLQLEGPFLFREGITHRLIEVTNWVSASAHHITPAQAARIKYSRQRFVYLDPGEAFALPLRDGSERRIRLVSVTEEKDSVIGLIRRAVVRIEIEGKPVELICAPYVMPTEVAGLRLQADTTSGWLEIPQRVQFSVWDSTDPIVDTNRFGFPLPGYRLFSHEMQAYNEPVHLGHRDGDPGGQRFYHNYGVDLAGAEGHQKVVSAIDGVVVQAEPGEGDLSIRDDQGLVLYYGHLDSIRPEIETGALVRRGQWVGVLGRRGASGNFAHLHVGVRLPEGDGTADRLSRNLNLYPWLVAAYRAERGDRVHAVAGPHVVALTGERVRFDGRNSLAPSSGIRAFRWEFHDGTTVNGTTAEKAYDQPGCYMATLWTKDAQGMEDVDFCRLRVYTRNSPEKFVPTFFVTYEPSREVGVNEPVNFRIWPQGLNVEPIQIDFGDGTVVRDYRPFSVLPHSFATPGIHIVTVSGTAGKLSVTQKARVIVK